MTTRELAELVRELLLARRRANARYWDAQADAAERALELRVWGAVAEELGEEVEDDRGAVAGE